MDCKEIGWEVVDWINLAWVGWQAVVNMVMNLQVSWRVGNFLTSWVT